ncbi:MAG: hypothetical protein JWN48_4598 [Myxococcaceae bacterium]|nr:hypothetical protein [Myxococcaceae bacterium]
MRSALGLVCATTVFTLVSACSDPECPEGQTKVGTSCVRSPKRDAGADGTREGHNLADAGGAAPNDSAVSPSVDSDTGVRGTASVGVATGQGPDASNPPSINQNVPDAAVDAQAAEGSNPSAPCVPETEVCDHEDNNCNGLIDEAAQGAAEWFWDCDGDGYAAASASPARVAACAMPAPVANCMGWTNTEPTGNGYVDCDDRDAHYHPGASYGLPAGNTSSHDLNCNNSTEVEASMTTLTGDKLPVCHVFSPPCDCYIPLNSTPGTVTTSDYQLWADWATKAIPGSVPPSLPCAQTEADQIQFGKLIKDVSGQLKCIVEKDPGGQLKYVTGRQLCR